MIAIVNVSDPYDPLGVNDYELRINHEVIARFKHRRTEGLTVCLQEAAKAAERAKWERAAIMLQELRDSNS
jgi:hypothetical protein